MKNLSIKDFVSYNEKCFNCNQKSTPYLNIIDLTNPFRQTVLEFVSRKVNILTNECDEIFLDKHLYISNVCYNCNSLIESDKLIIKNKLISPLSIAYERFNIDNIYLLLSSYDSNETIIYYYNNVLKPKIKSNLMPIYKFKTKKQLLDKIKFLLTFS
jgi:hypothetical protein